MKFSYGVFILAASSPSMILAAAEAREQEIYTKTLASDSWKRASSSGNVPGLIERQCILYPDIGRASPYAFRIIDEEGVETIYICAELREQRRQQQDTGATPPAR